MLFVSFLFGLELGVSKKKKFSNGLPVIQRRSLKFLLRIHRTGRSMGARGPREEGLEKTVVKPGLRVAGQEAPLNPGRWTQNTSG